jgi:hypothetical protein
MLGMMNYLDKKLQRLLDTLKNTIPQEIIEHVVEECQLNIQAMKSRNKEENLRILVE